MKAKIHPKNNPVIFVDLQTGDEFFATSTLSSEEKKTVDGIEYFVIKVETSSASHPFYTGEQRTASKGDQIAKYLEKVKKAQAANKSAKKEESEEEEVAETAK